MPKTVIRREYVDPYTRVDVHGETKLVAGHYETRKETASACKQKFEYQRQLAAINSALGFTDDKDIKRKLAMKRTEVQSALAEFLKNNPFCRAKLT